MKENALLCDGCGCSKARCDAFKPPAIKCLYVADVQEVPFAVIDALRQLAKEST